MIAVVTVRQHLELAANMCRQRAERHMQAAEAINRAEAAQLGGTAGGAWPHEAAAFSWGKATESILDAIAMEEDNGITNTGDGK